LPAAAREPREISSVTRERGTGGDGAACGGESGSRQPVVAEL